MKFNNLLFKYLKLLDNYFFSASSYLKRLTEFIPSCYNTLLLRFSRNLPESDQKVFQSAEKDIAYYHHLITLIDLIYKKEDKLPKKLLTNLSKTILEKTLTNDLEISGLIHGIIINYNKSSARVSGYFSDFVEFFQKSMQADMQEKVNQITLFHIILKIINLAFDKNQENKAILIEGELHSQLLNLIFYWLKYLKDDKLIKKQNVLYLLIKTLKNCEYLKLLKIIFFGAFKFLLEKKLISKSNLLSNEIYDKINQSYNNYLTVDLIVNENLESDNSNLKNKTIFFKDDSKSTYSNFKIEDADYYEEKLFELIKKCEKKIIKFSNFSLKEKSQRKINLIFFENFTRLLSELNISSLNTKQINEVVINENNKKKLSFNDILKEYAKYFQICFSVFKLKYYNYDMFQDSNLNLVDELYNEFKSLINQDLLLKLIYLLYLKGRNLDACVLFQYIKDADYDIIYKLLQKSPENHSLHKLEFIWKIPYFEILANTYFKLRKTDMIEGLKNLMRKTSNHQMFKDHPLRKHYKIINFFNYLDYLDYGCIR